MSTRVHELAKELNVKSQEILDYLRGEGESIKASHLSSLEEIQIDKVRSHFGSDSTAVQESTVKTISPASLVTSPSTAPPKAPEKVSPPAGPLEVKPVTSISSPPVSKTVTPVPESQAPPETAEMKSGLGNPPVGTRPEETARGSMQSPPASFSRPPIRPGHQPGQRQPVLSTGLHRKGEAPVAPRPTQVDEQASTKAVESNSPDLQPSVEATQPQPQAPVQPSPLRRTDYIDPSGVRRSFGPPKGQQPAAPVRPSQPSGGSSDRQERHERRQTPRPTSSPNVPVFRSFAPTGSSTAHGPLHRSTESKDRGQQRQGQGPQKQSPSSPPQQGGASYTRPDKKFTPEQLKAMMQSGQIGGLVPPAPAKPPAPGTKPPSVPPGGRVNLPNQATGAVIQGYTGPPVGMASVAIDDEEERKRAKAGQPNERAARRALRNSRQKDRVTSPVSVDVIIGSADDDESTRRRKRPKSKQQVPQQAQRKESAELEPPVTVRNLSEAIGVKASDIMTLLFKQGKAVRINDAIPEATAMELAMEFGVDLKIVHERTAEDDMLDVFIDETEEGEKEARPPIITILGHVDHGKTSLLDKIRKADVAAHESGGITQHIGAYQVTHNGQPIAFLDTPGHEAFTSMRARGANVTDIVVLVVAADDGVMPQTEEAISHAKAADVPIVVALNKIDLPNVNLNRIFGELSQHGLVPEEYGGDTLVVKTSAHTGLGIPELLENLLLIAELRELKCNPSRPAVGTCLESQISEGRGVVATMLVQDGTLRVGDVIVCGDGYGRVRAMFNHRGEQVEIAGPSTPVEVSGLDAVPEAGEKFAVLSDLSKAREISEVRKMRSRELERSERTSVTLENLFDRMNEQRVRSLNIILKADVQGSLEALTKELEKLENTEIPIRILHRGVGGISESDIQLANASQAIVVGFRVAPEDRAISLADEKKIDIRRYDIIYQVTDEVKKAIEGMLVPEIKEVHLGRAAVRQVFKISKVGTVAGCFVTSGTIERSAKVRLLRDGREIYKGSLEALKRFKDDVREVREGFECGIRITNYDDVKVDDIIEAYKIEEIRRTL